MPVDSNLSRRGLIQGAVGAATLIGACDHLFYGRVTMSRALGVGGVTDEVRRQYIGHMTEMICGGLLKPPPSRM